MYCWTCYSTISMWGIILTQLRNHLIASMWPISQLICQVINLITFYYPALALHLWIPSLPSRLHILSNSYIHIQLTKSIKFIEFINSLLILSIISTPLSILLTNPSIASVASVVLTCLLDSLPLSLLLLRLSYQLACGFFHGAAPTKIASVLFSLWPEVMGCIILSFHWWVAASTLATVWLISLGFVGFCL